MGAAAAGPLSIVGLGLSIGSSVMGGQGKKAAADAQAQRLEQAAQYGKVKAEQTDAALSEELNKVLGNIDVIRSAAGIDPTSPTTQAIQSREKYVSDRQRQTSVNNILAQARQNEADARYTREAGDYALTQSYLEAGGKAVGAASTGFKNGTFSFG